MGSIRNTRILRFLLVIGAVVLTIFIYASYSTGPAQLSPQHMRAHMSLAPAPALQQQQQYQLQQLQQQQQQPVSNKGNEGLIGPAYAIVSKLKVNNTAAAAGAVAVADVAQGSADAPLAFSFSSHAKANSAQSMAAASQYSRKGADGVAHLNEASAGAAKKTHRLPTIDVDAGGGDVQTNNNDDMVLPVDDEHLLGNDMMEEQYVANIDGPMGNVNSSVVSTLNTASNAQSQAQNQQKSQQQQLPNDNANSDNNNNNSNNNSDNKNNAANKVLETDVLIPTSNLQKFIENADKILKNITVTANVPQQQEQANAAKAPESAANTAAHNEQPAAAKDAEKRAVPKEAANAVAAANAESKPEDEKDEPEPPSVIMTIMRTAQAEKKTAAPAVGPAAASSPAQPQAKPPAIPVHGVPSAAVTGKVLAKAAATAGKVNTTAKAAIDPTQGIPTEQIYEHGHINSEIQVDKICPNRGAELKLLILITSAQSHADARLAIRQTWAHYGIRRDVSTAFVLGRSTNETLNLALTQENYIYGDLIRGNFIDSYNNLTLKTISSLEWVDTHCPLAKFVLKTDDDMFINVPKLLSFVDSHAKDKRTIYGRLAKKWKPIRNKKSKYYVSTGQFSAVVFPSFTTGPAYVMTNDIIHDLYVRSLRQVYLKLEDVFTTGIVAQQLNIKRVHVNEFLNRRISFNPCNIRKAISVHMIKSNEQFDLWKKLLDQTTKCK